MDVAVENDYVDLTFFGGHNLPGLRAGEQFANVTFELQARLGGAVLRSRCRTNKRNKLAEPGQNRWASFSRPAD